MSAEVRVSGWKFSGDEDTIRVEMAEPAPVPSGVAGVLVVIGPHVVCLPSHGARLLAAGLVAIADEADRANGAPR